ncbi:hypothetical protein IJ103_01120 [Candidatus Saccharibacteria bacterium]|nr:hypothetical protein [Candidatus Saccharibacteria bacterium]MBQ9016834.1 hypothetical protein [Candidatus Saccharibacteria bacterium]
MGRNRTFDYVQNLSTEDFKTEVLDKIEKSVAFSKVCCGLMSRLTRDEKRELRSSFMAFGAPKDMTEDEVETLALLIASRTFEIPRK